jgi:hypothetical protein
VRSYRSVYIMKANNKGYGVDVYYYTIIFLVILIVGFFVCLQYVMSIMLDCMRLPFMHCEKIEFVF